MRNLATDAVVTVASHLSGVVVSLTKTGTSSFPTAPYGGLEVEAEAIEQKNIFQNSPCRVHLTLSGIHPGSKSLAPHVGIILNRWKWIPPDWPQLGPRCHSGPGIHRWRRGGHSDLALCLPAWQVGQFTKHETTHISVIAVVKMLKLLTQSWDS